MSQAASGMPDSGGASQPAREALSRPVTAAILVLYACATLQFIRFYAVSATPYLNLPAYVTGHERLPFQYRVLPALLIRGMYAVHLLHAGGMHQKGAFTADRAPLFLLGLLGFVAASLCTQALYGAFTASGRLRLLVFPVFLFTMMWTYSIHVEANFAYPYDMLAVAFFAAGLLCVARRRFWLLLLVVAIGTLNRETTLFLIPILLLDGATPRAEDESRVLAARWDLRRAPWLKALALLVVWVAIKWLLARHYAGNDRSEDYLRLRDNLRELTPRLWPALLNICGYMLPVVLLLRRDLFPLRFRRWLWVLPLWLGVMLFAGVIVETRIYGELCPYVAVALVLILEHRTAAGQAGALPADWPALP